MIIVLLQISAVHYHYHIANLPRFGVAQILGALKQLASHKRSSQLNGKLVDVIRKMAELLGEGLKKEGRDYLEEEEVKDVYLPDRDRWIYPVTELCLNDCDWLEESDTMHFLHPEFSEHLANVFCVRTKREHDEVSGLSYFLRVSYPLVVSKRETETDRQTNRERQRDRHRDRQTEIEAQRKKC